MLNCSLFDCALIGGLHTVCCIFSGKVDFSHVTDLTMEQIEHLENENRHLLSEVGEVRNKLNKQMLTEDCLRENEDMLQFYTGLPNFSLLIALLEVLKEGMARTNRNSLTLFQEMLIFLIRLRLNVPLQDLAYRYSPFYIGLISIALCLQYLLSPAGSTYPSQLCLGL